MSNPAIKNLLYKETEVGKTIKRYFYFKDFCKNFIDGK